jgi:hypothetical protein
MLGESCRSRYSRMAAPPLAGAVGGVAPEV